jgi:uncharacterized membrane protein YqhA
VVEQKAAGLVDPKVDLIGPTMEAASQASSIALNLSNHTLLWQVVIHAIFLFSALALAWIDRLTYQASAAHAGGKH